MLSQLLLEFFGSMESRLCWRLFLLLEILLAQEITYDFFYVAVLTVDGVI